MAFKPTQQQQQALDAKGRVLVSAAAGSGKTAVLCERIVRMILDEHNPVDADRLLVVTFTNAAASEMRTRIRSRLSAELHANPASARLQRQLFLLSKANICTMDSFCKNLITEYYYLLDSTPDVKLIGAGRAALLAERSLSRVIERYLADEDEGFMQLTRNLGENALTGALQGAVTQLHNYLLTLPFPERYLQSALAQYENFEPYRSRWFRMLLRQKVYELLAILSNMSDCCDTMVEFPEMVDKYGEALGYDREVLNQLNHLLSADSFDENAVIECVSAYSPKKLKQLVDFEPESLKKRASDCHNSCKKFFGSFLSSLGSLEEMQQDAAVVAPLVAKLIEVVQRYEKELAAAKFEAGAVDFSDVERMALRLLVDEQGQPSAVADELSERYAEVCVDEFQDTNDLQIAIFNALSDNGRRLFMVGDVKQSIYRFRKANPTRFLEYKNKLPLYDPTAEQPQCKVIMSGNFRSEPDICEFVNFTFGALMSQLVGEMNYGEEDMLEARRESADVPEPKVQLKIVDLDYAIECTEKEYESQYIASYIARSIEKGERYAEQDRPLCYGDFAVLVRSRNQNEQLARAFKQAGIPYKTDRNSSFFELPEVLYMLALLEVIDNPHRRLSLLAVMNGPLYRFTDDELAQIRITYRNDDLYSALLQYREQSEKVQQLLSSLSRYRAWAAYMSLPQLIGRLYDATGLPAIMQQLYVSAGARANLLMLCDYAAEYESESIRGLSGFVRYLNRCREKQAGIEAAGTVGEDAVQLMSVHNSKGMQFPVCICANLSNRSRAGNAEGAVQISELCGIGMRRNLGGGVYKSTAAYRAAAHENSLQEISEELRVLYVAMTRAKQRLVLCTRVKHPQERIQHISDEISFFHRKLGRINPQFLINHLNYTDWLLAVALIHPCGRELRECCAEPLFVTDSAAPLDVELVSDFAPITAAADPQPQSPSEPLVQQLLQRTEYRYAFDFVNSIAAKQTASRLAHSRENENAERDFTATPPFLRRERMSPAERGTAAHRFLQLCDYKLTAAQNIELLREGGKMNNDECDALDVKRLDAFLCSPLAADMAAAAGRGELYREREFMVELSAAQLAGALPTDERFSDETVVIQGVVDACYMKDGRLYIIDYKTDRVDNAAQLVERYALQLEIYSKALAQCYDTTDITLKIYSLWLGEEVSL